MSLFKIRTFWMSRCEDDECFDQSSLTTAKLNTDSELIITGSHNNILRIFNPSPELVENNLTGYKPSDLLIEKIFSQPILQISSGRLISGSSKIQLAVLQSRLLSVYALVIKEGATDHGVQNILQLAYEHKLRRASFNFTIGTFGGVANRDFICVQSLDGLLTFFEQESFAFCCFLPDFLLPSPMVFVKKSDSFVTGSSSWYITSFKYKLLSESGHNSTEEDNTGKKTICDWKFSLGEAIIDLEVVEDSVSKENYILVLGERNLFCLSDAGRLKYMKRLEFSPICFTNYILNDRVVSLVVAETGNLLIYQNATLKWAAQLQNIPVSIKRAILEKISGVIVLLSENGILECSYLGTEPSLFVAPPLALQPLDFEKVGQELNCLYKTIKNGYANDLKITNPSAEKELTLNVSTSRHLEPCTFETRIKKDIANQMCSISIELNPQTQFEEIQISVSAPFPLKAEPASAFFNNLSETASLNFWIFLNESGEIATLEVKVLVSFINNLGVPRTITKSVMLPMELVMEGCSPQKEGECKLTLNINQSPVALTQLFPEFKEEGHNAIAFKNLLNEGKPVTILLAKSSQRYRLQSDSFASLSLLIEQMVHRLKIYFSNKSDFSITFNSSLPAEQPIQYIQKHFNCRQRFLIIQGQLTQLSAQFRLIQKRLISKFKVKHPTPLSNLELLLEDTYNEILSVTEQFEEQRIELVKCQNDLSCALNVLVNVIKLMDGNNNVASLVEATFSPIVYDLDNQNWEDVIDASLCFLIRTILAKNEKDKLRAAHTVFDEVKDISKLEKHFTQVLERISKIEPNIDETVEEEDVNTEETIEEKVPIGSKIAESSTRLMSAKQSLLMRRHRPE